MAIYLNTNKPLENFKQLVRSKQFVDKSLIIEKINPKSQTVDKYICITRPRRFGKTSVTDMLGAYYSKGIDSKALFDKLKISECESYESNLNKHNVIYISFNNIPDNGDSYSDYIKMIKTKLINDINDKFPNINTEEYFMISDMLNDTKEKFIFLFDEWDYIFTRDIYLEGQNDFLEFLRNLLKDQPYISLVYMTGVLPIKKYSSGSALNIFDEFTFLRDRTFDEYFGFTHKEVFELCKKNNEVGFDEITEWYDGYLTTRGVKICNPRSVVKALNNGYCESYWTNTGAMDEVAHYLKYNVLDVREDVIKMINDIPVRISIKEEFRAGQKQPRTKAEIYSAMIVLGFLSYNNNRLRIPNKELMMEFEKALSDESFGYVAEIINNSERMLEATVNQDTETVINILHEVHNSEIPILQYNDENSLSCVVSLAYLYARDTYRIEREEKSGKGYVDFAFHPRIQGDIPFILELKKDADVDTSLNQIIQKEYVQKFKAEYKNSNILAVAICYDSKKKEHNCKFKLIDG